MLVVCNIPLKYFSNDLQKLIFHLNVINSLSTILQILSTINIKNYLTKQLLSMRLKFVFPWIKIHI